jgi:hypothetical protein
MYVCVSVCVSVCVCVRIYVYRYVDEFVCSLCLFLDFQDNVQVNGK